MTFRWRRRLRVAPYSYDLINNTAAGAGRAHSIPDNAVAAGFALGVEFHIDIASRCCNLGRGGGELAVIELGFVGIAWANAIIALSKRRPLPM